MFAHFTTLLSTLGKNTETNYWKYNDQDCKARREVWKETSDKGDGMMEHPFAGDEKEQAWLECESR